jgi:hypothetical protein
LATIHGRAAVFRTHHATTSLWAVIAATTIAVCASVWCQNVYAARRHGSTKRAAHNS